MDCGTKYCRFFDHQSKENYTFSSSKQFKQCIMDRAKYPKNLYWFSVGPVKCYIKSICSFNWNGYVCLPSMHIDLGRDIDELNAIYSAPNGISYNESGCIGFSTVMHNNYCLLRELMTNIPEYRYPYYSFNMVCDATTHLANQVLERYVHTFVDHCCLSKNCERIYNMSDFTETPEFFCCYEIPMSRFMSNCPFLSKLYHCKHMDNSCLDTTNMDVIKQHGMFQQSCPTFCTLHEKWKKTPNINELFTVMEKIYDHVSKNISSFNRDKNLQEENNKDTSNNKINGSEPFTMEKIYDHVSKNISSLNNKDTSNNKINGSEPFTVEIQIIDVNTNAAKPKNEGHDVIMEHQKKLMKKALEELKEKFKNKENEQMEKSCNSSTNTYSNSNECNLSINLPIDSNIVKLFKNVNIELNHLTMPNNKLSFHEKLNKIYDLQKQICDACNVSSDVLLDKMFDTLFKKVNIEYVNRPSKNNDLQEKDNKNCNKCDNNDLQEKDNENCNKCDNNNKC
jgi:hypothetical protein